MKMYPQPSIRKGTYWYIVGKHEGKTVLLGPESSEDDANNKGFDYFKDGIFEVYELPTTDRAKATQILKAKLLERSGDLGEALRPMRHTIRGRDV